MSFYQFEPIRLYISNLFKCNTYKETNEVQEVKNYVIDIIIPDQSDDEDEKVNHINSKS